MEYYPGKQIGQCVIPDQRRVYAFDVPPVDPPPYDVPLPPPLAVFSDGATAYAFAPGLVVVVLPEAFDPENVSVSATIMLGKVQLQPVLPAPQAGILDVFTRAPSNSQIAIFTVSVGEEGGPQAADVPLFVQVWRISYAPPHGP